MSHFLNVMHLETETKLGRKLRFRIHGEFFGHVPFHGGWHSWLLDTIVYTGRSNIV